MESIISHHDNYFLRGLDSVDCGFTIQIRNFIALNKFRNYKRKKVILSRNYF